MPPCQNHPGLGSTESCGGCRFPFCPACLVSIRGERLCLKCRNRRLIALQLEESADLKVLRRIRDHTLLTGIGGLPVALVVAFTGALAVSAALVVLAIAALLISVVTQVTLWLVEWKQH